MYSAGIVLYGSKWSGRLPLPAETPCRSPTNTSTRPFRLRHRYARRYPQTSTTSSSPPLARKPPNATPTPQISPIACAPCEPCCLGAATAPSEQNRTVILDRTGVDRDGRPVDHHSRSAPRRVPRLPGCSCRRWVPRRASSRPVLTCKAHPVDRGSATGGAATTMEPLAAPQPAVAASGGDQDPPALDDGHAEPRRPRRFGSLIAGLVLALIGITAELGPGPTPSLSLVALPRSSG